LSRLVTNRIYSFLEKKNVFPFEQHGFRKGRSAVSAVHFLLQNLHNTLAMPRCPVYAIFIDLRAAFDKLNRSTAVDAMIAQCVTGPILKLLQDMLQTDRLLVTDGMRFSETIEQNVGAPQGDNISPILFNTVTSDVVSVVRDLASVKLVIYADDIVAFS